jgi:hypothetical protein
MSKKKKKFCYSSNLLIFFQVLWQTHSSFSGNMDGEEYSLLCTSSLRILFEMVAELLSKLNFLFDFFLYFEFVNFCFIMCDVCLYLFLLI